MKEMKTVVDENGNYELKFTDMYLEMTMYDKKGKQAHRRRYIKILSAIILLYLIVFKQLGGFKLHLSFCGSILSVLYILMTYVERRSVLAVKGFGLSISSYYCLNIRKSTTFVPSQNIHKIVVNEIKHMVSNNVVHLIE